MSDRASRVILAIVCSVGVACVSSPESVAPEEEETVEKVEIEGVTWQLESYLAESGGPATVLPSPVIRLSFSGREINGGAGCNRYFGPYALGDGRRLTIGPEIGSTQMACAPGVMEQEQRYLALLPTTAGVRRTGDRLTLLDSGDQPILEYVAVAPATLEGVEWQATGINNGHGGVVSTATTSRSTASFAEGEISGNAGCNRYSAAIEIDGEQISIGPASSTRMFCSDPEGIMQQEEQFLAALARARVFRLSDQTLELRDEGGSLQVAFRSPTD